MLELLQSLPFVKTRTLPVGISDEKALFIAEFAQSVDELNDVLRGKAIAGNAYDLLDEL